MLSVPSVTMKGGNFIRLTRSPFASPKSVVTPTPAAIATDTGSPRSTASFVITMLPSAITVPHDRSTPAVRIISVCPMAMTPSTMTCWRMSEKFSPVRKRSLRVAKNAHAAMRARRGPSVASVGRRLTARLLRAEAQLQAGLHVLAVHTLHGLSGNERHSRIGVTARLLAAFEIGGRGRDAECHHLEWVLLCCCGDCARAHVADALASAVHRHDDGAVILARG